MTTEQDVRQFMVDQFAKIKHLNGYTVFTVEISNLEGVNFCAYNENISHNRGYSVGDSINAILEKSKLERNYMLQQAEEFRAKAAALESKAAAMLAEQTPALI